MVRPEALNERRQQYFRALRHIREAEPLCGNQKTTVGESGEKRWVHGKRVGKTSGMMLSIKEQKQKPHRAPTEPYKRRCRSNVRRQPEKKKAAGS